MDWIREKLVVALDSPSPEKAYALVDQLGDRVEWYKLGPVLFLKHAVELTDFLHRRKKRIFVDLKIHDIPKVAADTVRELANLGAELTSVHCLGGLDMLEAASSACRGYPLQLIGLTLLTSQTENPEIWPVSNVQSMVERLYTMALKSRLGGILCSAQELQKLPSGAHSGFRKITAGIRLPGEKVFEEDQKRVTSPTEALKFGADLIVMGRPVTLSREPLKVIQALEKLGRDKNS